MLKNRLACYFSYLHHYKFLVANVKASSTDATNLAIGAADTRQRTLASLTAGGHFRVMAIPADHARGEMPPGGTTLSRLNERSREIFRLIVDSYLASGELSHILTRRASGVTARLNYCDRAGDLAGSAGAAS